MLYCFMRHRESDEDNEEPSSPESFRSMQVEFNELVWNLCVQFNLISITAALNYFHCLILYYK